MVVSVDNKDSSETILRERATKERLSKHYNDSLRLRQLFGWMLSKESNLLSRSSHSLSNRSMQLR